MRDHSKLKAFQSADELAIKVTGLKDPLLTAVTIAVDAHNISGNTTLSESRLQKSPMPAFSAEPVKQAVRKRQLL